MPHANTPSHYHSNIFLLLLLLLLLRTSSSSYEFGFQSCKIREGVLGLTTGSTKDLTRLIIRAFLGDADGEWGSLGRRRDRESDPSPPAQAPESPYFPRFEAELGEMRENGPRQPFPRGFRVSQRRETN